MNQRNVMKMLKSYMLLLEDHPQGKTGHCPFSCQNPRLYLRHAEKETGIHICHLCTLGILHRDGAEISDQLGAVKARCSQ